MIHLEITGTKIGIRYHTQTKKEKSCLNLALDPGRTSSYKKKKIQEEGRKDAKKKKKRKKKRVCSLCLTLCDKEEKQRKATNEKKITYKPLPFLPH